MIWSNDFSLETDTSWYIVTEEYIQESDGIHTEFSDFLGFFWEEVMWNKEYIGNRSFPFGSLSKMEIVRQSPSRRGGWDGMYSGDDYLDLLDWFFRLAPTLLESNTFAPRLGVVAADYIWDGIDSLVTDHHVEIVSYFNPLTTQEAFQARSHWNQMQRAQK